MINHEIRRKIMLNSKGYEKNVVTKEHNCSRYFRKGNRLK